MEKKNEINSFILSASELWNIFNDIRHNAVDLFCINLITEKRW